MTTNTSARRLSVPTSSTSSTVKTVHPGAPRVSDVTDCVRNVHVNQSFRLGPESLRQVQKFGGGPWGSASPTLFLSLPLRHLLVPICSSEKTVKTNSRVIKLIEVVKALF